ncbi:MAG: ABC transporter substrate-binding protein, partial [Planctomycetota bacterium]
MKFTHLILAGVCLALTATGCPSKAPDAGGGTDGAGSGDAVTGTLVFARGSDSKSLDPINVSDGESVKVIDQLYDTLVAPKATSTELEPGLATEWSTSEDRLTWTFTIRSGVKFHDGTVCDAPAVKFNLDRLIDEANPHRFGAEVPYSGVYTDIASFEAPDASTLKVQLKKPSAVLLAILSIFPASIASPAAIQKHGKDFGSNPCGTGPFAFERWQRDTKLVLKRNPDYFGEKAKIAKVIFVPYAEQEARKIALERGEAHMMDNVDFSLVESIQQHADLRYEKTAGMNFAYLALNNDRPPFNDPKVRRAVAHAIDKQA